MIKSKLKRMLSLILAMSIMLTTLNGISFSVTAAEASSGTDENGFSWTSDGTSVTITGYNPSIHIEMIPFRFVIDLYLHAVGVFRLFDIQRMTFRNDSY